MNLTSEKPFVFALYLASILLAACLKWSEHVFRTPLSRLVALLIYSKKTQNMPVSQRGKKSQRSV